MDMFATLDFDLSQPYAIQFLRRFATVKKSDLDGLSYAGAKYLIELSVLGKLKIPPSILNYLPRYFLYIKFIFRSKSAWHTDFNHCRSSIGCFNEDQFEFGLGQNIEILFWL